MEIHVSEKCLKAKYSSCVFFYIRIFSVTKILNYTLVYCVRSECVFTRLCFCDRDSVWPWLVFWLVGGSLELSAPAVVRLVELEQERERPDCCWRALMAGCVPLPPLHREPRDSLLSDLDSLLKFHTKTKNTLLIEKQGQNKNSWLVLVGYWTNTFLLYYCVEQNLLNLYMLSRILSQC